VLARNLGKLENCTGFRNTGVVEDEGQYLQDVYPTNNELGGTGWYGFNPRAHLTEVSDLLTPQNVTKIRKSWHQYWDENKSISLEKTPSNLLMTRFLQAAFPQSYFIVVRRHPIAVSMANQRWKKSTASLHVGFEHWLRCYGLFEGDKKHLKHVYELKYEDYIENPARYHQEIATFVGTRAMNEGMEEAIRRMEAGEDPDQIEEEMGDVFEGADPLSMESLKAAQRSVKRRQAPNVDPELYDL
jgi:hypothetical protein